MKSPLKQNPVRNPGQSLDDEISDVIYNDFVTYYMLAVVSTLWAAADWWQWYTKHPPFPIAATVLAVILSAYAAWKIRKAWKRVKNLKQGRDGERAVGQYLENLRSSGAEIFHDMPGEDFNLDHVIVHTTGIYVVETKTWSKPDRGEAKIQFNGTTLTKNGLEPDRNPIVQVSAAQNWLGELLEEETGKKFPIRPVVLFPGWYIESTGAAKRTDIWVLNPKALPAFIGYADDRIKPEDVKLAASRIRRYISDGKVV